MSVIGLSLFFAISGTMGWMIVDCADLRDALHCYERESRRYHRLTMENRTILQSLEDKEQVITDLVCKRLTLREAAARFKHLNEICPGYSWEEFCKAHPGHTAEERYCHEVLANVRSHKKLKPEQANELVPGLEKEFQEVKIQAQTHR
jgi:hypothetical protein